MFSNPDLRCFSADGCVLFIRFFPQLIYLYKAGPVAAPCLILGCVPFIIYIPCFSFVGGMTLASALKISSVTGLVA